MYSVPNKRRLLRTIGARLTVWGASITLLACLITSVILYLGLRWSLTREVDGFLEGEVYEFRAILQEEDHESELGEVEQEIRRELGSRLRGDLTFRLLDRDGRLRLSSDAKDRLPDPWDLASPASRSAGDPTYATLEASGSEYRVASLWVNLRAAGACLAQAAYSLNDVNASLATFRRVCLTALLVTPALALVGGYVLARRSLRPVEEMTRAAREIEARDLGRRIPLSQSGDEIDQLAQTLNDMLARIETHVRRMEQFTADASHEFRTPLTALRTTAEVALSRPRSADELRRVLEDSLELCARLGRIAEDLLLLARADAGQDFLKRERMHLEEALRDTVDLYGPVAEEKGVSLGFSDGHSVELRADGSRLRQVFSNLLDNSIKHTPSGGRIDVSLHRINGIAEIRVVDTGAGIPAEHLPRVFDRFYRADPARSRREGGAGLGLAICRTIVQAHHGRMDIQSIPGQGTTVSIELPVE